MTVSRLVNLLFVLSPERDFLRVKLVQRSLLERRSLAAGETLSQIIQRRKEFGSSNCCALLTVVKKTARPGHSGMLLRILSWAEILTEYPRSRRCMILETLARVGQPWVVPHLSLLYHAVADLDYDENPFVFVKGPRYDLNKADRDDFAQAMLRCRSRRTLRQIPA